MSQVLLEDTVFYGDYALLCANDLATMYDIKNNTYYINLASRDELIINSGFANIIKI